MLSFLNKPYPYTTHSSRQVLISLFIGVFVAFFLVVFQPFGISKWIDENKMGKLLGYGVVSFIVPLLVHFCVMLLPDRKREDEWKVRNEIVNMVLIILFIAAGNLLYSHLIGIARLTVANYFMFIFLTFSIGIFPISFSVIRKHNRFLALNQQTATKVNAVLISQPAVGLAASTESKKLVLVAENEKDTLEVAPHHLLFLTTADNYTEIHYLEEGTAKKILLRGSLKRMEEQLIPFSYLVRCHRAFLVNLEHVTHVEGNAAGYKLTLRNSPSIVPVSRNFGAEITTKLQKSR